MPTQFGVAQANLFGECHVVVNIGWAANVDLKRMIVVRAVQWQCERERWRENFDELAQVGDHVLSQSPGQARQNKQRGRPNFSKYTAIKIAQQVCCSWGMRTTQHQISYPSNLKVEQSLQTKMAYILLTTIYI